MTTSPTAFTDAWRQGLRKVFSIRLADIILGHTPSGKADSWWGSLRALAGRRWSTQLILLVLGCSWTLALNALLAPLGRTFADQTHQNYLRIAAVAGLDGLMLLAAKRAWEYALIRGHKLDDLLSESPDGGRIAVWLSRYLDWRVQVILPTAAVLLGEVYYGALLHDNRLHFSVVAAVAVAFSNAIGANIVYWLTVAPGIVRQIKGMRELNVRWHNPASTPGIRLLGEGFGFSALLLLIGAAAILIPAFLDVPGLSGLVYYLFAGVIFLCFRVGVYVYYQLYVIILTYKHQVLEALDKRLPKLKDVVNAAGTTFAADIAAVYDSVERAPALPFSTPAAVQYSAALVGVIAAFVVQYLTSR